MTTLFSLAVSGRESSGLLHGTPLGVLTAPPWRRGTAS
jgi:hypothetical protein